MRTDDDDERACRSSPASSRPRIFGTVLRQWVEVRRSCAPDSSESVAIVNLEQSLERQRALVVQLVGTRAVVARRLAELDQLIELETANGLSIAYELRERTAGVVVPVLNED